MLILQSIVLGITQGITEFLPISSDGHLILVPSLLGWERLGLGFDVALHAGTLIATVVYFRADLWRILSALARRDERTVKDRRLGLLVIGATVPSVVIALAADPFVERVEALSVSVQLNIVAGFLLVTAGLLAASEMIGARIARASVRPLDAPDLPMWKALLVGVAQGFAVAPGLSRSGITIATGLGLGMSREQAARFSFLLSVPIVGAALAKKLLLDVIIDKAAMPPLEVVLVGVLTTAVVGYAAISFLLPFVRKHSLYWFAAYTAVVGAGILLLHSTLG